MTLVQRKALQLSSVLCISKREEGFDFVKKALWYAAAALGVVAAMIGYWREIREIAFIFWMAVSFSLLMSPVCIRLERRVSPGWAAAASVTALCLAGLTLVCTFVPYLLARLQDLAQYMMPVAQNILLRLESLYDRQMLHGLQLQNSAGIAVNSVGRLTASIAKSSAMLAAQTGRIIFALVLSYYFLRERKTLCAHLLLFIPAQKRLTVLVMLRGCRNAAFGYLSGLLKTCAFISAAMYIGLLILGIPNAWLLSLIMGVFELLPYAGPFLAAVPILLSALPLGGQKALLALILILGVQLLEGNFISPYFTAASTSLHPALALIGVYIGGSLFGLWGILFAVPCMVAARSFMWSLKQLRQKEIH